MMEKEKMIVVVAVTHTRRSPKNWKTGVKQSLIVSYF